ncbi:MAG: glycosyltransferase family 2 protein [Methylobacter sp.]|nr:glycosyltransferase family 2 protein [Methylobacter sp.]MDZ4217989.1 glycosyltransferase family 2 protein [Methylobacter sp.]
MVNGGLRAKNICKRSLPGKPLISIITVVFNAAETLQDTIISILKQSYANIEYIVIDGGSSDATVDILRQYDQAIDYWVSEKDRGVYDAMNKGIAACTGDYVGMLNSDDMFSDEHVVRDIVDRFCQTKVDAVFSYLNIVDKNDIKKIRRKYRVSTLSPALLRMGVMPAHPTFYCKRSCYEQAVIYKTDYKIAADFEMLARLLIGQRIVWSCLDRVTVIMRSGGLSDSGLMARVKLNREIVRACKENGLYTHWLFLALKIPIRLVELIR